MSALDRLPRLHAEAQEVVTAPGGGRSFKLEARRLTIHYGAKRVLHDVDLAVAEHEIFGIIGPAGTIVPVGARQRAVRLRLHDPEASRSSAAREDVLER
jgi:hypothetical protein